MVQYPGDRVAGVADAVVIDVGLVGVGCLRAVVASVADAVGIGVGLGRVAQIRTVVDDIPDSIQILVLAGRIRCDAFAAEASDQQGFVRRVNIVIQIEISLLAAQWRRLSGTTEAGLQSARVDLIHIAVVIEVWCNIDDLDRDIVDAPTLVGEFFQQLAEELHRNGALAVRKSEPQAIDRIAPTAPRAVAQRILLHRAGSWSIRAFPDIRGVRLRTAVGAVRKIGQDQWRVAINLQAPLVRGRRTKAIPRLNDKEIKGDAQGTVEGQVSQRKAHRLVAELAEELASIGSCGDRSTRPFWSGRGLKIVGVDQPKGVADVAYAVVVQVGLIWVVVLRAIITGIAEVVGVAVLLQWIGDYRAVVQGVRDAVVVIVTVARVTDTVAVYVCLIGIRGCRAVVAGIQYAVIIRVGCGGQVAEQI